MLSKSVIGFVLSLVLMQSAQAQGLLMGPDSSLEPRERWLAEERLKYLRTKNLERTQIRRQLGAILWQLGEASAGLHHWELAKAAYLELFALRLPPDSLVRSRCSKCIKVADDDVIHDGYERVINWMSVIEKVKHRKFNNLSLPAASNESVETTTLAKGSQVTRVRSWGYIDKFGQWAIKPTFEEAFGFNDGIARVKLGHRYGFIDKFGKWIVQPTYPQAGDFSEGLAPVKDPSTWKWGFIDNKGAVAIKPQFDYAYSFSDGLACVVSETPLSGVTLKPLGYIDHQGKPVIPPRYFLADQFHEGLAQVSFEGSSGSQFITQFIDKSGSYSGAIALAGKQLAFDQFFSEGIAPVVGAPRTYCYVDKTGLQVMDREFSCARSFSEGLACVTLRPKGRWRYINKAGRRAIESEFDDAHSFSDGVACVRRGDRRFVIDHDGKVILHLNPRMKHADSYHEGLLAVQFMYYAPADTELNR